MMIRQAISLLSLWMVFSEAFAPKTTPVSATPKNAQSTTSLSMALTLYGHPGTRSPLVNWACFELQVEFTMGDLSANPHPFGQVPCLTDDNDVTVFESGAILQHIQQHYSKNVSKKQSAAITSWIAWANASLDPICFLETPQGKVYDTGLRQPNRRMDQLNDILAMQEWLVEENFSVADVAVASYLLYVLQFFPDVTLNDKWPAVTKYLQACAQRTAYGQAFGAQTQTKLLSQLSKDLATPPRSSSKRFGMF
jgi:glutathione S-transferase